MKSLGLSKILSYVTLIIFGVVVCPQGLFAQTTIECRGFVNASAGNDCTFEICAQALLTSVVTGPGFEITIDSFTDFDTLMLDASVVGQQYEFTVRDTANDVMCSGDILFEDTFVPIPLCASDTIACDGYRDPQSIGFPIPASFSPTIIPQNGDCYKILDWDACGEVGLCYTDSIIDNLFCDINFCTKILRTWTVTDPRVAPYSPNTASCVDTILIRLPDPSSFGVQNDFTQPYNPISCADLNNNDYLDRIEDLWPPFSGNGILDIDEDRLTGVTNPYTPNVLAGETRAWIPMPLVTGIPQGIECSDCILYDWKDNIIEYECGRYVERTWKIRGWCSNQNLSIDYIQVIQIIDDEAPIVTSCTTGYTRFVTIAGVTSEPLVKPTALDDCSEFPFSSDVLYSASSSRGEVIEVNDDFFLSISEIDVDSLTTDSLDARITWEISDGCNNYRYCVSDITLVKDTSQITLDTVRLCVPIGLTKMVCPDLRDGINAPQLTISIKTGSVSFIESNSCIDISGISIGNDTICLIICDSLDTQLCDTTIIIQSVVPYPECRPIVYAVLGQDNNFNVLAHDLLIDESCFCQSLEITIGDSSSFDSLLMDASYLGQTVSYTLLDTATGSSCGGQIYFQDDILPVPQCGRDTARCQDSIVPEMLGFPIPVSFGATVTAIGNQCYNVSGWDSIGATRLCYEDNMITNFSCDVTFCAIIYRQWTVSDPNLKDPALTSMSCVNTIFRLLPKIPELVYPRDFLKPDGEISCTDLNLNGIRDNEEDLWPPISPGQPVAGNGVLDVDEDRLIGVLGYNNYEVQRGISRHGIPLPSVTGKPEGLDCGNCTLIDWSDHVIEVPCARFVERTWRVRPSCGNQDIDTSFFQRIKLVDDEGPIITQCPTDYSVYVFGHSVVAGFLNKPIAYDYCDDDFYTKGVHLSASSSIGTVFEDSDNSFVLFLVPSEFDTSLNYLDVIITWSLGDYCGNVTECTSNVTLLIVILPVELINFHAEKVGLDVQLDWSTASEINNQGFEVQRSINGLEWEALEFVAGHGTISIRQDYEFFDTHPFNGANYYRLKQIDFNGDFEYSDVEQVDFNVDDGFNIYPNPTSGELIIEGEAIERITIFNSLGQVVKIFNLPEIVISIEELQQGLYLFEIETQGKSESKTVVKW